MKCLIFSDSHGRWDYMERAVRAETPDRVIQQVRGNCDGAGCGFPEERELFLDGRRLWLLHGHRYYVKMGLGMLVEEARVRGVDGVFFGHTHQPVCYLDGRLWVLNPGAIGGTARSVTYGVMEIRDREMSCRTAVLF